MKKIAILYKEYKPVIDALKHCLSDCIVDCFASPEQAEEYDLTVCLENTHSHCNKQSIACHYSLLPAFDCEEPVKEAILEGVKVTGITIYYTNPKKIITQYPIFISNTTHYDDLQQELEYLEQTILPVVVKKIVNNEQFEIQTLLKKGCGSSCGAKCSLAKPQEFPSNIDNRGCSSCNH